MPSLSRAALALAAAALTGFVLAPGAARADAKAEIRRAGPDRTPSDVHQYVLQPVDDGTFLYDGHGFSAVIARDGAVTFHAEHWTPRSRFGEVATGTNAGRNPESWPAWPVPLPSGYRPTPYDDRERQLNAVTPTIPVAAPIFIDAGSSFDLTDEYARSMGSDPYATTKIAFLSDTFDFRMKLAAREHRRAMSDALGELPDRLNEIWTDPHGSPTERRQIIYLLWQETSNDEGGAAARKIIADFAAKNFSPEEARRFQR